jgi:hypothetical protein
MLQILNSVKLEGLGIQLSASERDTLTEEIQSGRSAQMMQIIFTYYSHNGDVQFLVRRLKNHLSSLPASANKINRDQ